MQFHRRVKRFHPLLFISCVLCFKIKSDEEIITFSSSNKPRIRFSVVKETNEVIESLELVLRNQRIAIPIVPSNDYEIELADTSKVKSGRSLTFEVSSVISEKKCSSRKDINSIELACEEEERIKPISAKLGILENQNVNQNVCFAERKELWDSCSFDLYSFVSMKCANLQTCSPFFQMDTISQRTNCDPLTELFVSVAFKCLRHSSFTKSVCFQFDLDESIDFSASLIPDSDSYPLFKGNLVVFFTTTIPQQCETDSKSNLIEVWLSQPEERKNNRMIPLKDSSTIYEADFGQPIYQTYIITISFADRQLLERTTTVSSATVITSPPTPFDFSVAISADSALVTFKWKKLNPDEFTSIDFEGDCEEFKGIAYYHFGEPKKREEAKKYCKDLDESLLPTVRSTCRLNTLKRKLKKKQRYWIGLKDIERNEAGYDPEQNKYQWDDGSTVFSMEKSAWQKNEPNSINENCYEMSHGHDSDGCNDVKCDNLEIRPACEKKNFDCYESEPHYTVLIYDENLRIISQYQYEGDDIRIKEEFTQEISDLENNKKYHYSIRSENCGVSSSTLKTPFKNCFDEPPSQIEKTTYRAGVVPEFLSFTFPLLLPFFGIVCSDIESMKTIKISTNEEHYDCFANPSQFSIVPKTSLITCELKSNQNHSTSLSLDVLLTNGSLSQTTTISVRFCPFDTENCPADCFEICGDCSTFLDASSCVFPCSWCSSSKSCLSSNEECSTETKESSSPLALILICVLIPVFVLMLLIVFVMLYLRNRRRSTVAKLDAVLATTNISLDDTDFQI